VQGHFGEWGAVLERGQARVRLLRDPRAPEAGGGRGGFGLTGPERSCVTCRTRRPKRELIRIVRDPDGRPAPDDTGAAPGRGAYVCRRRSCAAAAPGLVGRALRMSLAGRDLDTLRTEIEREMERG
jgi:hypothetical protein